MGYEFPKNFTLPEHWTPGGPFPWPKYRPENLTAFPGFAGSGGRELARPRGDPLALISLMQSWRIHKGQSGARFMLIPAGGKSEASGDTFTAREQSGGAIRQKLTLGKTYSFIGYRPPGGGGGPGQFKISGYWPLGNHGPYGCLWLPGPFCGPLQN